MLQIFATVAMCLGLNLPHPGEAGEMRAQFYPWRPGDPVLYIKRVRNQAVDSPISPYQGNIKIYYWEPVH